MCKKTKRGVDFNKDLVYCYYMPQIGERAAPLLGLGQVKKPVLICHISSILIGDSHSPTH